MRRCRLLRSLLGVKRTRRFAPHMSAFDPKRTSLGLARLPTKYCFAQKSSLSVPRLFRPPAQASFLAPPSAPYADAAKQGTARFKDLADLSLVPTL
jgi:hypothetical protein